MSGRAADAERKREEGRGGEERRGENVRSKRVMKGKKAHLVHMWGLG